MADTTENQQAQSAKLARLLRLAVLLNHSRPETAPPLPNMAADDDHLTITLPESDEPTLLGTDLEQEQAYMHAAGFQLNVVESPPKQT